MRPTARRTASALVAALTVLSAARPASAQRARPAADTVPPAPWERRSPVRFAVGAAGLYQSARGAAPARVSDGGGFDAFGALQVSALALAVGYQRSEHRLPGVGTGRAVYDGVFVEPRASVAPFRNFTPYVAGRAAFLRQRVPASALFQAERRSLTALGAGVGTLVWLAPAVQLDLAGLYTDVRGGSRGGAAGGVHGRDRRRRRAARRAGVGPRELGPVGARRGAGGR
jgi:hypothetical protein